MYYRLTTLISIFFLLLFYNSYSDSLSSSINKVDVTQNTPVKKLDKTEWENLKKKVKIKDYKPTPIKEEKTKTQKPLDFSVSPTTALIIKWTLFGISIVLLLWFILKALGINPFRKKTDKNKIRYGLEELEENLDTADIDPHLYAAIKNKEFNLAIRLYYLMILQRLALQQKIKWKKHKTNRHYIHEIRNSSYFLPFTALTLTYERCWFGKFKLSENEYNNIQPEFVNFLHNIL